MHPATTWDGEARAWTVMGRLRDRQAEFVRRKRNALLKQQRDGDHLAHIMTSALMDQSWRDAAGARWTGGPTVLAFLFAHPAGCTSLRRPRSHASQQPPLGPLFSQAARPVHPGS
jgi:hypothetical protein